MEPYEEAEAREAEWDRRCDAAPRCSCCDGSIYPYDTYVEIDGEIYCERCIAGHTHFTEDLDIGQI